MHWNCRFRGRSGTLCTGTADFMAGAALREPRSADCVNLCLQAQTSWQAQRLRTLKCSLRGVCKILWISRPVKRALDISGSEHLSTPSASLDP